MKVKKRLRGSDLKMLMFLVENAKTGEAYNLHAICEGSGMSKTQGRKSCPRLYAMGCLDVDPKDRHLGARYRASAHGIALVSIR